MDANIRDEIEIDQPKTMEERVAVAKTCYSKLGLTFPAIIDNLDNKIEEAYAAWPDRLYIVDKSGRIAYKGGKGPRGFDPMDMAKSLKKLCST